MKTNTEKAFREAEYAFPFGGRDYVTTKTLKRQRIIAFLLSAPIWISLTLIFQKLF